MDLVHTFLNVLAPLLTFFTLLMFLPPFLFFKFLLSTLRSIFSENVAGKVALITGASSGIGEQLAYEYAKRGACLVLVARREELLQNVAERAREYGSPDVLVIPADVAKLDDCKRFIEEAINHFGQLDHLVNNAGITSACMFEESTNVDNFRPIMDINFWGSIYPTYFGIPHLRRNKGKIIVNASVGGWIPSPRLSLYNASKAALISFYDSLRVEVGPDVKITIVTPGFIESEMTQGKFLSNTGKMELHPEMRDVMIGSIPTMYGHDCARGILNGVCRGDRNVTEPAWFKVFYFWQVFCPEVVEWANRARLMAETGTSQRETLIKTIMDMSGAKYFFYPPSIQSPDVKAD